MPTHFAVCPRCRNHGHLVFPNDVQSYEVMSQSDAIRMTNDHRFSGDMPGENMDVLFKEIYRSGLPLVTASDTDVLLNIEENTEDLMRKDPIIHPKLWGDIRRPVINVGEEICSFCQEALAHSRPYIQ